MLLGADGMGQEPLLTSLKGEDVAAGRRLREVKRVLLDSAVGCYGCVVPKGAWHTVEVLAPSVIYELALKVFGKVLLNTFNAKFVVERTNYNYGI